MAITEAVGVPRQSAAGYAARVLAASILTAVWKDRQPFDQAFASSANQNAFADMPWRDRAFARAIATLSLRRYGQIQDILKQFTQKPLPTDAHRLQTILAVGAAQILFMDVAPHAAINIAVEQAKAHKETLRFSALMNAVLRRIAKEGLSLVALQDAGRLNTPTWLYDRWTEAYGPQTAHRIAHAHLEEPPLDLSTRKDPIELAHRLNGVVLPTGSVRVEAKGRIEDIPGFDAGDWWVQDTAAAMPVLMLGDIKDLRVADLCGAPGGKTAQLAARGAHVTAVDISPKRIQRLQANLRRLHLHVDVVTCDVEAYAPDALFDAVLLDAPCSATGTIRRNPDIPYLKSQTDVQTLAKVQQRLLKSSVRLIKPGGTLVYCTCSLEREEGESQIDYLLQTNKEIRLDPIKLADSGMFGGQVTSAGYLRTLPFHGMDGFFAAKLRRIE